MIHFTSDIAAALQNVIQQGGYHKVFALTDNNTFSLLTKDISGQISEANCIIIPAGEQHKNLSSAQIIWEALKTAQADRRALLVNIGGGMVTDLGGFCASTYMRGIDFVNVPTSLLSMVDAAVGGKNGINFQHVKNLIGTFNQPRAVLINPAMLSSLPLDELRSGWGEVIKHGIIAGGELWQRAQNGIPALSAANDWDFIVRENIRIKESIVNQDPTEQGIRRILNLGHTFGHALESEYMKNGEYISHGHAVALGIALESIAGRRLGVTDASTVSAIKKAVESAFQYHKIPEAWTPSLLNTMLSDKKTVGGRLLFSIPTAIGVVQPGVEVTQDIVKDTIAEYNQYAVAL